MKRYALALFLSLPCFAKTPYEGANLNSYQAAAHLLSRFSYGATPGQVEAVVHQGLDRWLEEQLQLRADDSICQQSLRAYPALSMDLKTMDQTYIGTPQIKKMAMDAGVQFKDPDSGKDRQALQQFVRDKNLQTERELLRQLLAQKVTRAVYTKNQLQEVMTDFWFNHFNVSRTSNTARPYILSYERDVIRPNALGDFRGLLGATAKHPAMLLYLNNAQSMASPEAPHLSNFGARQMAMNSKNKKQAMGLNENYARELMELHTLGVDGGYTQKDVTEVARVLTGWTMYSDRRGAQRMERMLERFPDQVESGQNNFVFLPFLHDSGTKMILGNSFPAGQGLAEGEHLLDLLAADPHTANRIARKFAIRFICDEPDQATVAQLARVFQSSNGSSAAMVKAIYNSPAFWSQQSLRAKVKNPLEYTVSSVRILGGQLQTPETQLPIWVERMGQNMYGCVPPTGYPDRSEQWISSGTLVYRVNFAFALASGKVRGVSVPLPQGKLEKVAASVMPGRPLDQALKPVKATLNNSKFFESVRTALPPSEEMASGGGGEKIRVKSKGKGMQPDPAASMPTNFTESQKVAGVLLSCPEFQRR
ncbi:DUF1800 domain-containing protein [bacterium]|nr:DUF1800 domain-containing protein [bacterium]